MSDSKPDTIAIVFARDPLHYREGDVDIIIEAQREWPAGYINKVGSHNRQ
jgi:hypothetical protein